MPEFLDVYYFTSIIYKSAFAYIISSCTGLVGSSSEDSGLQLYWYKKKGAPFGTPLFDVVGG